MAKDKFITTLENALQKYIKEVPFDNVAVLLSFLHFLRQSELSMQDAFAQWQPDSVGMVEEYGGTNCVGAMEIVKKDLAREGIDTQVIISPSNRLPHEVSYDDVPFQHVALFATHPEENIFYLVDPGLGIVFPVPMDNRLVEYENRIYTARLSQDTGELKVKRPDGTERFFDFIHAPDNLDIEHILQKPLLRATIGFKIESFSPEGKLSAAIKIDLFEEKVRAVFGDFDREFRFSDIEELFSDENFIFLADSLNSHDADILRDKISTLIEQRETIVSLWYENIQREFFLRHSERLSPFETSWKDLEERGYRGGGVVICLTNEHGDVLMYRVPEGKEKHYLGRYKDQLNLFVETADSTDTTRNVSSLEDFNTNLSRAFEEELGIPIPEHLTYREVDYMPGIRARCVVANVDSSVIEHVREHHAQRNQQTKIPEFGEVSWVDPKDLRIQEVEPNAAPILSKLSLEQLLP